MAARVRERVEVLLRRLRRLAQHQPARVLEPAEMAALAVGLRPVGHLGRVRDPLPGEPGEDPRVELGPEVVRVREERVAVAALEQRVEHPRAQQRRVDVAVAGRAPLQRRVRRPLRGRQPVDQQLRLLVLDEVGRHVGGDLRVALQQRERVVARREGVHEHERDPRAGRLPQRQDLLHDHVEEGLALLDLEQRLRAVHAHRRAEPAVELDDHRLVERRVALRQLRGVRQLGHRVDGGLRQHAGLPALELLVVVAERGDGGLRHALALHLLDAGPQPLFAHTSGDATRRPSRACTAPARRSARRSRPRARRA